MAETVATTICAAAKLINAQAVKLRAFRMKLRSITHIGDSMKKPTKHVHSSRKKIKPTKRGSNQSPLTRAQNARKRFMASDKSHEATKIDVAEEILGIALQYIHDNLAYQRFCRRSFFTDLTTKPGKRLDLSDIANTVSQYVCKATIRRRKQDAYKISRVVDCCLVENVEPWGFKDFIAGRGSFTKAYKYAIAKYSRSAENDGAATLGPDVKTEQNDDPQDTAEPSTGDDDVLAQNKPANPPEDEKQAPNRKKPDWPKWERSVNTQATTNEDFSAVMSIGVQEEILVRISRRAYDGDYVDLYIKEVLPQDD